MGDMITEKRKIAESNDSVEIRGEPVPVVDDDSVHSGKNAAELIPTPPSTQNKEDANSPFPTEYRSEPDNSGAWQIPVDAHSGEAFKEIPVDSLGAELELPSKKLSTNLTGTHYLDYKNMMDTLLFPKGTTIGVKDEIILNAAVEHIVGLAKKESKKSIIEKGTPFISAGALLAKLWES